MALTVATVVDADVGSIGTLRAAFTVVVVSTEEEVGVDFTPPPGLGVAPPPIIFPLIIAPPILVAALLPPVSKLDNIGRIPPGLFLGPGQTRGDGMWCVSED